MSQKQNPYRVGERPIPQFKQEAKAWDEGFEKAKRDDFDAIVAMHNALLGAKKAITDVIKWYTAVIEDSYSAS